MPPSRPSTSRYAQLDSIRGLAALIVVLYHLGLVPRALPASLQWLFGYASPLKVLLAGHGAVVLFFLLSGFVLSLPLLKEGRVDYVPYLIKRVLRIYVPYLVGILVAMGCATLLYRGEVPTVSRWFNDSWTEKVTWEWLREHVLMLGNIHSDLYNNPIWSLVHEMRISIVFPLVMLPLLRAGTAWSVAACVLLSAIAGLNEIFHLQVPNGYRITHFDSLHYLAFFIVGAWLARNRDALIRWYAGRAPVAKGLLFVLSFVCFTYATTAVIPVARIPRLAPLAPLLTDYVIALGSSGFIVLALASTRTSRILLAAPLQFVGRISYSLYLYHLIVILGLVHLLHRALPLPAILLLAGVGAIAVAAAAWYLVERPCTNAGKTVARRVADILRRHASVATRRP